jgi:hypothetical protein
MRQDDVRAGSRHVVESHPAFIAAALVLETEIFCGLDGAQCSRNIHPSYRVNADING